MMSVDVGGVNLRVQRLAGAQRMAGFDLVGADKPRSSTLLSSASTHFW